MAGKTEKGSVPIGAVYEGWTVVEEAVVFKGPRKWLCRCRCGAESLLPKQSLVKGKSKGCKACDSARRSLEAQAATCL